MKRGVSVISHGSLMMTLKAFQYGKYTQIVIHGKHLITSISPKCNQWMKGYDRSKSVNGR